MVYRQIIIDEDNGELLKNETFDEEYEDESCEGCEEICGRVSEMLEEAGIETEDHDEMLEALEGMKLVKKDNGNGNGKKKIVKKNGNRNGGKKEK